MRRLVPWNFQLQAPARYRHRSLYTGHVMIKRTRHDCSDKFYNANESRKNRVKKPYSSLLRDYCVVSLRIIENHPVNNNPTLSAPCARQNILSHAVNTVEQYPSYAPRCSDNFPVSLAIKTKVLSIVPTKPDTVLVFDISTKSTWRSIILKNTLIRREFDGPLFSPIPFGKRLSAAWITTDVSFFK